MVWTGLEQAIIAVVCEDQYESFSPLVFDENLSAALRGIWTLCQSHKCNLIAWTGQRMPLKSIYVNTRQRTGANDNLFVLHVRLSDSDSGLERGELSRGFQRPKMFRYFITKYQYACKTRCTYRLSKRKVTHVKITIFQRSNLIIFFNSSIHNWRIRNCKYLSR